MNTSWWVLPPIHIFRLKGRSSRSLGLVIIKNATGHKVKVNIPRNFKLIHECTSMTLLSTPIFRSTCHMLRSLGPVITKTKTDNKMKVHRPRNYKLHMWMYIMTSTFHTHFQVIRSEVKVTGNCYNKI